jgi:hypothetical protein
MVDFQSTIRRPFSSAMAMVTAMAVMGVGVCGGGVFEYKIVRGGQYKRGLIHVGGG